MHYEKPELTEFKMDAEIGAYQNDFDPGPHYVEDEAAETSTVEE